MITVAIINNSTVLADSAVAQMTSALQTQVSRDFVPVWGIDAQLTFVPKGRQAAAGAWPLAVLDDSDYGVQCTIVIADNQEPTLQAGFAQVAQWRWKIAMAFRSQELAGVTVKVDGQPQPGIFNAYVEPAEVVLPAAWSANLFASALLLRFVSREPRGLY